MIARIGFEDAQFRFLHMWQDIPPDGLRHLIRLVDLPEKGEGFTILVDQKQWYGEFELDARSRHLPKEVPVGVDGEVMLPGPAEAIVSA